MARILIATIPVLGHASPFIPIARALIARGHDVLWYTGSKYRAHVAGSGARFVAYKHARDFDDARLDEEIPGRTRLKGLAQLKLDLKFFIDAVPGQLADIREILRGFPADVVLADTAMLGASFQRELGGPPTGVLGVVPLIVSSIDTAPFGLGLPPSSTFFGRLRNRGLNWFVENIAFREVQTHWNEIRAGLGLPPTGWWMDHTMSATFYLQPSVPGFEYPRSDLSGNLHFIGPVPAQQPVNVPRPPFWEELDGSRPIIHVTQGTVANTAPNLIQPALEGLANEDVLVVVSTGNRSLQQLGLGTLPKNARAATFLSYPDLLPKVSVMVTNGGYGGVQTALSHGVPLVVAGASEDKPEVAARVAWSGVGVNLKTAKPSARAVRQAVREVLEHPRFRERARALASEYGNYDAIARVVDIVERTLRTGLSPGHGPAVSPGDHAASAAAHGGCA